MTDARQPGEDGSRSAADETPPGVPRWVTALGVVMVLVLLVLLVATLAGGDHGPSRHQMEGQVEPHRESAVVASVGPQHERPTAW